MIRGVPILLLAVLALAVVGSAVRWASGLAARRRVVSTVAPGRYEFDPRIDQVKRRLKGVGGPDERRDGIVEFLDTHGGVEAYVEPKTVVSPKTVVLIDAAGEWRRFELREDAYLRRLAAERGLRIFDAARTGYPPRMRRRRAGET